MLKTIKSKALEATHYVRDLIKSVAVCFLIMPPVVSIVAYALRHFGYINFGDSIELARSFKHFPFWNLFIMFIFVGVTEEGMFRHLIQDKFLERFLGMPKLCSILLASAIFGAAHLSNPGGMPWTIPQSVGAACLGLYMGYLYRRRGLAFAMFTHGLYDFAVTIVFWAWL